MGGGGKSGGEIEVFEYTMSMHVGAVAAGEGLTLLSVKIGDKEVWNGEAREKSVFAIDDVNLFGGEKKEGGVKGMLWWLPGDRNQSMPAAIWSRLGLTRDTCPGFRGLASLFFTGTVDSISVPASDAGEVANYITLRDALHNSGNAGKQRGFLWGMNNPYLRAISVRARRAPIGLNPSIALIRIPDSSIGRRQYGANPAHIIFECMTNRDWGMGERMGAFDIPSFEIAAQTLFDEKFGLNMIWTRQSQVQQFIGEVLDHIQGAVYIDPRTGKHTMKLLRGDYDMTTLRVIDPSNATLSDFQRKSWGEITNEVTVTMTNAETGQEESVTAQDLAAISAQGGVASSAKNYYGVPYQALAIELAERDLAAAVQPVATVEATVTRSFWDTFASDVLEVSWPEYDIERLIMRVSTVNKGGKDVVLSLYEDIFGMERASYLQPGDTGWVNPTQPPSPLLYYHLGTAPAFLTASAMGLTDPGDLEYPEAMSALIIGPDSSDDISYELTTNVTDVNGQTRRDSIGTRALLATFVLPEQLAAAATSYNVAFAALMGAAPAPGDFIQISSGNDAETEIVTVESLNSGGNMVLNRGTLDTVPRTWPAGTRAWVIPSTGGVADILVRGVGEAVTYWPQTRTTGGLLPLNSTPPISTTLTSRPYRPNRPANVMVNGVGFATVNLAEGQVAEVTWARRNRTLESTQIMKWGEADVAPEAGQVVQIDLLTLQGGIITSIPDLTGNSYSVPQSAFAGATNALIRVVAVRDGLVSLTGHTIEVTLPAPPPVEIVEPPPVEIVEPPPL